MTTTPMPATPPPPPPPPGRLVPTLDVSGTAQVPFWRLCLVEFRKSYDTRAGMWLLITIGILVTVVEAFILILKLVHDGEVYFLDFAFAAGGLASILLPVLGILLVTSEWSQRSAMVSFALEPRRIRVVLAKWLVAVCWALVTILAMFVIATVLTAICDVIQPDTTFWAGSDGTPAIVPFTVVQMLTMTIGFSFAALLLNTPAAIVLFFVYWYALPGILALVGTISDGLKSGLEWINFQAAVSPLIDGTISTAEEWGKVLTSTLLWIGVPLAAGLWRILRAEVK